MRSVWPQWSLQNRPTVVRAKPANRRCPELRSFTLSFPVPASLICNSELDPTDGAVRDYNEKYDLRRQGRRGIKLGLAPTILSWVTAYLFLLPGGAGGQTQNAPPEFDARVVESATTISGRTCLNPLIGFTYELPEGMQVQDARTTRIVKARGERGRTGIGPEAEYILWGSGERHSIVLLCGGASEQGQVMVTAIPLPVLRSYGPGGLEKLVEAPSQAIGAEGGKSSAETFAGRVFSHAESHGVIREARGMQKEVFVSTYATEANSYAVLWNFVAYKQKDMKNFTAAMNSVKIEAPTPASAATVAQPSRQEEAKQETAPDFQRRLTEFMTAWLTERDQAKAFSFVDKAAYEAPPVIGTYCSGWYRRGASVDQTRSIISANLMGVPSEFPKNTATQDIFTAWNRLPPEWTTESANDVGKDHFLIAMLYHDSLGRIFRDQFTESAYKKFLEQEVEKHGHLYWAVFPELMRDGDVFVIFTLWQAIDDTWRIVHIDIVCQ